MYEAQNYALRAVFWLLVSFTVVFVMILGLVWLFPCKACEEKRRARVKI